MRRVRGSEGIARQKCVRCCECMCNSLSEAYVCVRVRACAWSLFACRYERTKRKHAPETRSTKHTPPTQSFLTNTNGPARHTLSHTNTPTNTYTMKQGSKLRWFMIFQKTNQTNIFRSSIVYLFLCLHECALVRVCLCAYIVFECVMSECVRT